MKKMVALGLCTLILGMNLSLVHAEGNYRANQTTNTGTGTGVYGTDGRTMNDMGRTGYGTDNMGNYGTYGTNRAGTARTADADTTDWGWLGLLGLAGLAGLMGRNRNPDPTRE